MAAGHKRDELYDKERERVEYKVAESQLWELTRGNRVMELENKGGMSSASITLERMSPNYSLIFPSDPSYGPLYY